MLSTPLHVQGGKCVDILPPLWFFCIIMYIFPIGNSIKRSAYVQPPVIPSMFILGPVSDTSFIFKYMTSHLKYIICIMWKMHKVCFTEEITYWKCLISHYLISYRAMIFLLIWVHRQSHNVHFAVWMFPNRAFIFEPLNGWRTHPYASSTPNTAEVC